MAYRVGPNVSVSQPLAGNAPLRAVLRRSAAALGLEVVSGSLVDTSLPGLFHKLDERLGQAWVVRGSAPTYTEDTITIDLVTFAAARLPQGTNASTIAERLNQLVTGLPLVSLDGRTRTPGEAARATELDAAARAGQAAAEEQGVGRLVGDIAGKLGLTVTALAVIALVVAALIYLPKPKSADKSE